MLIVHYVIEACLRQMLRLGLDKDVLGVIGGL